PTYFNSTLVRLTDDAGTGFITAQEFQFHLGAINRLWTKQTAFLHITFQFHLGAINRFLACCPMQKRQYFNSTLVRLTAIEFTLVAYPHVNFNSTLVRLTVY